jgi:hypothetical protein
MSVMGESDVFDESFDVFDENMTDLTHCSFIDSSKTDRFLISLTCSI